MSDFNPDIAVDVNVGNASNPDISVEIDVGNGNLPEGGTPGQVLTKTEDGAQWRDAAAAAVTSVNGQTGEVQITPEGIGAQPEGDYLLEESDPTVPEWAKHPQKPIYTAEEIGALPADTQIPTIPTNVSAFTNDAGYLTGIPGEYVTDEELNAKGYLTEHQDLSDYAKKTDIPDVSAFITRAVNDLENYYLKSQIYSREEIDQKVSAIPKFSVEVVSALPSAGISATTIYLIPGGADGNLYTEYINVNGTWEILGSQRVDLTGYATQTWTLEQLAGYQPKGNYLTKTELPEAINTALTQAKESGEFDGEDGYTPVKGKDYFDGKDGVSPTVFVSDIAGGHRITITDVNGTKTVDVLDGSKGDDGRGVVSVARTSGNGAAGTTDTYTITYTDGAKTTFEVYNGKDGSDGYSPSARVDQTSEGAVITVTDKTGTTSAVVKGTKEPLMGTTGEITPVQVAQAIFDGRDVMVSHEYNLYGTVIFSDFACGADIGMVAASVAFVLAGQIGNAQLVGYIESGEWVADVIGLAKAEDIPDTSEFITRAVNDLENYYRKNQTYNREEIDQKVSAIPKFSISVVSALPTDYSETTIYLVPGGVDDNLYTEYINVNGTWEILGSQRVDLTGYATQSWTLEQLAGYQPKGDYALKSELPIVPTNVSAFQNDAGYAKKSELPTKRSDLSEDATHRVVTDAEKTVWNGKLDENKLPEAIDDALAQAKASGEFDGAPGYTPVKGVDYWTENDQEDIVQQVIAALGTPVFGRVDTNKVVTLTGQLMDGTYTFVFEEADGNVHNIGSITTGDAIPEFGTIDIKWIDNVKIDATTGEETTNEQYSASEPLEAWHGYTYTFTQVKVNNSLFSGISICYYNQSGAYLGRQELWGQTSDEVTKDFTVMEGAATFKVRVTRGVAPLRPTSFTLTYKKTI